MSAVLQGIFWFSVGLVVYAYVLYPILITIFAKLFGTRHVAIDCSDGHLPSLTLLICAHNEEAVIRERVENALAMDYPTDRMQILIASDGSDDGTAHIVRAFDKRITFLDFSTRRGKAATLNHAIQHATGEIVLLSDANTVIQSAAARRLVRWFVDPSVGVVCGKLQIRDSHTGMNVDGAYWKYETFLKTQENRLGALLGSNGAIYAIRRSLFEPIPANTIVDDFVIPLRAKIRAGCEIIYDDDAIGFEEAAPRLRDEFKRRVRIGAGGFQAIGMLGALVLPRFGWTAFAFLSHKVCRWISPMAMIAALAAAAMLAVNDQRYRALFAAQLMFYAVAVVAMCIPGSHRLLRPIRLVSMFVSMNAALFLGCIRWMRGRQQGIWQRTQRATSA